MRMMSHEQIVIIESVLLEKNQWFFSSDLLFTLGLFDNPLVFLCCRSLAFRGCFLFRYLADFSESQAILNLTFNRWYKTFLGNRYKRFPFCSLVTRYKTLVVILLKAKVWDEYFYIWLYAKSANRNRSQTHGSESSRPLCLGTMSSPPNQPGHQSIRESEPVVWGQIFVRPIIWSRRLCSRESVLARWPAGWFSLVDSTQHRRTLGPQSPFGGRRVNTPVFQAGSSPERT